MYNVGDNVKVMSGGVWLDATVTSDDPDAWCTHATIDGELALSCSYARGQICKRETFDRTMLWAVVAEIVLAGAR